MKALYRPLFPICQPEIGLWNSYLLARRKRDELAKSQKVPFPVIPAKAGIQGKEDALDPGFRRGDGFEDFLENR